MTADEVDVFVEKHGACRRAERTVAFRLWPPVAIGAPLFVGWVATVAWGDPIDLARGGSRSDGCW